MAEEIRGHVVKEDDVEQAGFEREELAELVEGVNLGLDEEEVGSLRAGAAGGIGDRAGEIRKRDARDVVVLDEDGIMETESMAESSATADRVFLEAAQARCGLPRVVEPGTDRPPRIISATNSAVRVAIPERRPMRFKAVRSRVRRSCSAPESVAMMVPAGTRSPSLAVVVKSIW